MTDAETFMAMRAAFRDAERFVEAVADRIEALTEQLAAARRDAEEAEAYAGELEAKLENLLGGSETVLEAWDHHMRDVVVPASLHDAIEELRADVAEVNGGNDAKGNM